MGETRCIDDADPDFKETCITDSHKWLFLYPGKLRPEEKALQMGFTNEVYEPPPVNKQAVKGRRKQILEKFYRQLFSLEVIAQLEANDINIEEYITEYLDRYKNPDDMPLPGECLSKNEKNKMTKVECPHPLSKGDTLDKMKAKWPLYSSKPLTVYTQTMKRDTFGKSQTITKPLAENYENKEY